MKIHTLIAVLVLVVFSTVQGGVADQRPNVIVIVTDDQGYGDLSCHGNPWLKTPEMDRLYREGVRLTDFHVDPTCAPTRAALMTGRYSARTGVWLTYGSRHHLRRDEITMADIFKRNGYRTAIFGKWHLGDNYPFRPMDRGFDESFIHGGGVITETPDYWDNNYYDDTYFRNGKPEKAKGYCTDVWVDETIRFVESNRARPFFAYLSFNAPHGPLHVPERYRAPFADQPPKRAAFYGMITSIDENIGRLRAKLKELGLARNTIIVFFNDNGTNDGVTLSDNGRNGWTANGFNAGMRGNKTSRYEGGHRAACFIHWPEGGLTGGRDVDGVTAQIDLLPTFIDLCDLEFNDHERFDGISLAVSLKKGAAPLRTVVVHDQGRFGQPVGEGLLIKDKHYSVMRGSWRLVGRELYDLNKDPAQRNDIAASHPEIVGQLREAYETWWTSITQRANEFCPFVINPANQHSVMISSQNLLGDDVAYSQYHVRKGEGGKGWTVIDVEVPGTYRIALRRWPRESGLNIRDKAPPYPQDPSTHEMANLPCKVFDVTSARLQVGGYDQTLPVDRQDGEVVFNVDLPKGEQRIQGWFISEDGELFAVYYAYIEPMP